jgi:hypothetical protein
MSLADSDSKNQTSESISKQDTPATEIDAAGNPIIISSNEPVEKEFDQIKKYLSYDPTTNIWSQIGDFKTIHILDDTTQLRPEHYLYYSFWAYDVQHKRWKRVDISDYGYKHGIHPASSTNSETSKPIEETTAKKKSSGFWKNLGLSFSVGGGATYYYNDIKELKLFVTKGNQQFYVQVPNSTDAAQNKAHLIRWFYNRNKKTSEIEKLIQTGAHDKHSLDSTPAGNMSFQGIGLNIPIMLGLHYTFFNKLRLGAGGNFEVNYLKKLTPAGVAANMMAYKLPHPWFYNIKWFGTIGYKVFQRPKDAVIIDTQLGIFFDLGTAPIENLFDFIHVGFYGNIGIAHERKLNDYFKFFYRLSVDWKKYNDHSDFKPSNSTIEFYQPALHLEIGTTLHFGRNMDEEEAPNEDAAATQDHNTPLDQVDNAVASSEDELNKAADAKNRFQRDKDTFKGLFR